MPHRNSRPKAAVDRMTAILLIGICIGIVVVGWQGPSGTLIRSGLTVEDRAVFARRLGEIETSLALERHERQTIANEIAILRDAMATRTASVGEDEEFRSDTRNRLATASGGGAGNNSFPDQIRERFPDGTPRGREAFEQFIAQQQFDRFVAAGIAPHRAHAIMQREEEIDMEVLRARYAAMQSGATPQEIASITPMALLRGELGNAEYAQYLDARGRRTSIGVREILKSSRAEIAGLKPGDEIVMYNGQRAFDMDELTALTYQVKAGTTVPLQVVRDDQLIQIFIEAGPIGIRDDGRTIGRPGR